MRTGGILPLAVPESTNTLRQAPAATPESTHRQLGGHRAALLRAARGQNTHRDAHPRHAPLGQLLLLAVHVIHETVLGDLVNSFCLIFILFYCFVILLSLPFLPHTHK